MVSMSAAEIISLFGLRNASVTRDEILCSCPYSQNHQHGDRNPSFRLNAEKGVYICFAAGTEVITNEGVRPIESLVGKSSVIINGNDEWEQTEFVNCGTQDLLKLTVARDGNEKVIYVTAEHEWIVHGYRKKVPTFRLRPGMRLEGIKRGLCEAVPSKAGLRHGFIYGDGSLTKRSLNGNFHHHVYGMTPSKGEFIKRNFDNWHEVDAVDKFAGASITAPYNMKEMPSPKEDRDYLMGFVCGLFAADGDGSNGRFFSAKREEIEKLRVILTVLGIPSTPISKQVRDVDANMGCVRITRPHTIYYTSIYRALTPDILYEESMRPSKDVSHHARTGWRVVDVCETDRREDVYCCETSTGSFYLGEYLLTGNCFSCGEKGNLVKLAQDVLGMSKYDAVRKFDVELTPERIDEMVKKGYEPPKPLTPLQMDISNWKNAKHDYWHYRGFTDETIGRWQLGYDSQENRVVVPVYVGGELVGWSKRAVNDVDQPKWQHSHGMDKSHILFGQDNFTGDSAIVVEAPLSVIMLDQYGVSNAVATFGCKMSDAQAKMLRNSYNSVMIWYDPDGPGQQGMRDAVEKLEDFVDVYVVPPTRDDPAGMTLEEDLQAIRLARPLWAMSL